MSQLENLLAHKMFVASSANFGVFQIQKHKNTKIRTYMNLWKIIHVHEFQFLYHIWEIYNNNWDLRSLSSQRATGTGFSTSTISDGVPVGGEHSEIHNSISSTTEFWAFRFEWTKSICCWWEIIAGQKLRLCKNTSLSLVKSD